MNDEAIPGHDDLDEDAMSDAELVETDQFPEAINEAADNFAVECAKLCVEELRRFGTWDVISDEERDGIMRRLGYSLRSVLRKGYGEVAAQGLPAISTELKKITSDGKKLTGTIACDVDSEHAESLLSFAGKDVAVVCVGNINDLMDGIEDCVRTCSQLDLVDAVE